VTQPALQEVLSTRDPKRGPETVAKDKIVLIFKHVQCICENHTGQSGIWVKLTADPATLDFVYVRTVTLAPGRGEPLTCKKIFQRPELRLMDPVR